LKRLLLAAALALIVHGFLLSLELDLPKHKPSDPPKIETLTLTFPHVEQARPNLFPSSEVTPRPARSFVSPNPSNNAREKTPPKKKSRIVHDRDDRGPVSSQELSKTMAPESRAVAPVPEIREEVTDREGLSRTESAADVMGEEGRWEAGPGGARPSAGGGSGHAPGKDPTYSFSASIHEAIPAYRANPSPEYPAIARRRGYEGTVLVEVLVNREGRVEDLRLSQSSGYPVLDQAAMTSMRGWLFEPATINEKKVEMWVKVPVRFHLK
jgi:periplasmic protein TonB